MVRLQKISFPKRKWLITNNSKRIPRKLQQKFKSVPRKRKPPTKNARNLWRLWWPANPTNELPKTNKSG